MKIGDIEVESVKVLSLQPTDILVIRVQLPVQAPEVEHIKTALANQFGITNKILVLSQADVEIVRKESA